jgi:hypothetical protein
MRQAFWRHLKEAECTEHTLSLKEDTFFLGEERLGSQLMLRPVYERLQQCMQQRMEFDDRYFFVAGTPGK